MTGSLAYRKNEAAILKGEVPAKYTRILPHVPGVKVLEIGCAEGVLSLLMAGVGKDVIGLERQRERFENALRLSTKWGVDAQFVCADITDRLDLMDDRDTLVAVRTIYYLGANLDKVIAAAPANVVLCGNKQRAAWSKAGVPNKPKIDNYYASLEGMKDVLTRNGYQIVDEVADGDPIVVGKR